MGKKIPYEEIKEYIEGENGNGCKLITTKEEFLENNLNSHDKLEIRCKCGNIYEANFYRFKDEKRKKKQCTECGIKLRGLNKRLDKNEYKKRFDKISNGEYDLLSDYEVSTKKVLIKHNECNNIYPIAPYDFIYKKSKCPKCFGGVKSNNEEFNEKLILRTNNEFVLVGEYINNHTYTQIEHLKCGSVYNIIPQVVLDKSRNIFACDHCENIEFNKEMKEYVKQLTNNEYELLSNVKGVTDVATIKHIKCQTEWDIELNRFIGFNNKIGSRCPKCSGNLYKGERTIGNWLNNNHFKFKNQYTFNNCKDKIKLRFDFAVFDKDDNLITLIEYQGEAHYFPVNFRGISDKKANIVFKNTIRKDKIKRNYCEKNNINLLEIPYWEFDNIEIILEAELSKYEEVI